MQYDEFLRSKIEVAPASGFEVVLDDLNECAFEWQKLLTQWALRKGKCALFEDCGLGKSLQQLDWSYQIHKHTASNILILAPLAVSRQTATEGEKFGIPANLCESQRDIRPGINITNYEKLHHFDTNSFVGIVLDESSILKHQTSETRRQVTELFRDTPYKLCCTATPAPNDYMELGNHAEFLGVMTRSEMLSTYFVHDGSDTQKWRLKGHAQDKFWEWVASWAVVLQTPRDLGFEQEGFDLPPMDIKEHIVKSNILEAANGQMLLLPDTIQTLNDRRAARRNSLAERVQCAADIANAASDQYLVWCDLNDEGAALEKAINGAVEVAGRHSDQHKADAMMGFTRGEVRVLVSKPGIAGWGMNWQNCNNVIFVGLSDSFEAYYQAVRRCWRYGQNKAVNVHIITSEGEGSVLDNIKRKQKAAGQMVEEMVKRTKYILSEEIRGTIRQSESYHASKPLILPAFLEESA